MHYRLIILMSDILVYATPKIIALHSIGSSANRSKSFLSRFSARLDSTISRRRYSDHVYSSSPATNGIRHSDNFADPQTDINSPTDSPSPMFGDCFDPLKDAAFYSHVSVLCLDKCVVNHVTPARDESLIASAVSSSSSSEASSIG